MTSGIRYRGLQILPLLLLTSCVSNPAYPPSWPNISADSYDDCPKINGIYSDIVDATTLDISDARKKIVGRLSGTAPFQYTETEYRQIIKTLKNPKVKIMQSPGAEIEFSLLEDQTIVRKKVYSRQAGDFQCDDGGLKFSEWEGMGSAGLGIGRGETTFRKGVDGSLIVKWQGGGAGLGMLIIPIVVLSETHWHRYMPLDH